MPILIPAIDLKDGKCVRLQKGDMERVTIFNDNPSAQAKEFEDQGFSWLHVVDLDGAIAGENRNLGAVDSILTCTNIPIQLGGGIRTLKQMEIWLEKGVKRIILGTVAVLKPDLVKEACKRFPENVAVGIDAQSGKVATDGWIGKSEITDIELANRFQDVGVTTIIHTDIERDGVLTGLNFESTLKLANSVNIPVIISGGLANIEDVKRLLEPKCAILEGAITGRAIYDGSLDANEALSLIQANRLN